MREVLIHIGYHKTGSTWLQQRVFADDRLGFAVLPVPAPIDEAFVSVNPFAFSADHAKSSLAGLLSTAEQSGSVPVISHERLSGDIDTGGVDARSIADRLAETFPEARILIVIREQRDMLLSVYKTEVQYSTETLPQRWRDRSVIERRRAGPTLEYFEYHHLIGYYQRLFGAQQVCVLPYEALRRDPLGFVSHIAKFVGLSSPTGVEPEPINQSYPAALLELNRWINKIIRAVGLGGRFQGPVEERVLRRLHLRALRAVSPLIPRPVSNVVERRWRASIDQLTKGRYEASNRMTQELTGLDLGSLGYCL